MESLNIPPTIFVAFGVVTAALLAGFFSFLNLVSAKENKVSEFRLAWVDGLREEIATYTCGVQELVRVDGNELYFRGDVEELTNEELAREWYVETRDAYIRVGESLSKIQLRLNQKHIKEKPESAEAKLMSSVLEARDLFNTGYYKEAASLCVDIRDAAAPLLKKTWDQVKNGEPTYRIIRASALAIIVIGTIFIFGFGYYAITHPENINYQKDMAAALAGQPTNPNTKTEPMRQSKQSHKDTFSEVEPAKSTIINITVGR